MGDTISKAAELKEEENSLQAAAVALAERSEISRAMNMYKAGWAAPRTSSADELKSSVMQADELKRTMNDDDKAFAQALLDSEVNAFRASNVHIISEDELLSDLEGKINKDKYGKAEWHSFFETSITKDTNPKDAVGTKKVPMSVVSGPVMMEVGLGMLEGALKYGRHNYREAGVRGSVYYDATLRHLMAWWEGEDIDPASKLSHITKAITSLVVLRDSMIRKNWVDDRPPQTPEGWIEDYNKAAAELIEKYPNPVPAYTQLK